MAKLYLNGSPQHVGELLIAQQVCQTGHKVKVFEEKDKWICMSAEIISCHLNL